MSENTKIPKRALKPPSQYGPRTTGKPLSTIAENGVSSNNDKAAKIDTLPQKTTFFRRRSKSASDLRPLRPNPVLPMPSLKNVKPVQTSLKPGQKRVASEKNCLESKAKVPKIKIPDWDYKSRFQELQKKHTALQDHLKENKSLLSDLQQFKEENDRLKQENASKDEQLALDIKNKKKLTLQIEGLVEENTSVKSQLSKAVEENQQLRHEYELLRKKFDECLSEQRTLQRLNKEFESELTLVKHKYSESERNRLKLIENLGVSEDERRHLHNTIQDLKGNIRVFCRVRPAINNEEEEKQLCALFYPDDYSLEIRKSKASIISGKGQDLKHEFCFDKVFPPEADQQDVFEDLSQLVQSALDGYHVCVFAYGQTGSGKTYTMQGTPTKHGMIPRTIDLIFEKLDQLQVSGWTYKVSASFLEIYNESIKDLLQPNSKDAYDIRYNEGRGVTVTNLKIIPINSADELKEAMEEAHKNRATAATDFNEHSSRSHAVTQIHLDGSNSKVHYTGSIHLVDLAGSESAKTSSKERIVETKNINRSLSALGNVMLALHNKDLHVPYRNSKLTYLLQSCLGGNSKTLMFVNISPFEECFVESLNSLRFAARVKEVKMSAKKNRSYVAP